MVIIRWKIRELVKKYGKGMYAYLLHLHVHVCPFLKELLSF
jgi:hypothetical protein